jgi:1,4-alpha-glucan branching enzyme
MKKILLVLFCNVMAALAFAQTTSLDPTISPALFQPSTTITVTYDVTGTSLANLTQAWAWVWIPNVNINAKYNFNPASSNTTQTNNAKFVKSVVSGRTLFTLTFKPSDFFASSTTAQTKMGILLKGNDWSNGQTSDFIASFWDGSFQLKLTAPADMPLFVVNGEEIQITAETPVAANYELFVNGVSTDVENAVTSYSYTHVVTETSGAGTIRLVATANTSSSQTEFQYILSANSPEQVRPSGIISGINYHPGDPTKVTLCILAPGKTSGYVRGDFSNWDVLPQNLMKRDGEFFWIEISGLTAGMEYGFQYLMNESLYLADPYADKILDPDDQYIPDTTYPNLKSYPEEAVQDNWYFNRIAVFQTGQVPYTWQITNFEKPAKEKLVVYELLVRDFFENGERSYQNLIDTLSYFKQLGVNAIELMPIMEFNGNESWGYNPAFMFAPDKYYGTKNKLKEFIDKCHQNGIAVILDITMNHQDLPNPYVLMDFNFTSYKPAATNKWFNTDAKHPFNVFYDMNHESPYTKDYLDTVNHYWLNEYKVDGFRFDLSKGFTQVNNPTNVGAWSNYDATRIALLKRMADQIWNKFPTAYVILEHLSVNSEEKELAEYRAAEGKGMMLWGKMTEQYNQLTMGFEENSDVSGVYFKSRTWTAPHLVSYMESHDEERLMVKNILYGNTKPDYSTKEIPIALKRMAGAATIFYTVPGPKMLWQFGELGYDQSINLCEDGSNNSNCRVNPKPVLWDYQEDPDRKQLFTHVRDLIRLRKEYDVFSAGDATFSTGTGTPLIKILTLKNSPYTSSPANAGEMNALVVVNFDLEPRTVSLDFPHIGEWYDYYRSGMGVQVGNASMGFDLAPGEYKLFTDVQIESPIITGTDRLSFETMSAYPNPVGETLFIEGADATVNTIDLYSPQGFNTRIHRTREGHWDVRNVPSGFYVARIKSRSKTQSIKLIKK